MKKKIIHCHCWCISKNIYTQLTIDPHTTFLNDSFIKQ